jgi:hypothetical protein
MIHRVLDTAVGVVLGALAVMGFYVFFVSVAKAEEPTPLQTLRLAQVQRDTALPEPHTWQCVSDLRGKFLFARPVNFQGIDLVLEAYDRDADHKYDFALLYEYVGSVGELRPFPTRYITIVGGMSYEYVDVMGNGRCADIRSVEGNPGETAGEPAPHGGPHPEAVIPQPAPMEDEESCDMEEHPPTKENEA